jgi:hypothetical protein
MRYVRLQKLRAVEEPVAPPGDPSTYPYGQRPDKIQSLPVDYWFEGFLVYPPFVGKRVAVFRFVRNGIRRPGVFWSTRVTEVGTGGFQTLNSVYRIEEVAPFEGMSEMVETLEITSNSVAMKAIADHMVGRTRFGTFDDIPD